MKTNLFTILVATAGLLIAGSAVSSQAGPSESTVRGQAAATAAVAAPASCHAIAKAEADHCAIGNKDRTCDQAAKSASICGSHDMAAHQMTCCTHGAAAAVAMNCEMHAKMKV